MALGVPSMLRATLWLLYCDRWVSNNFIVMPVLFHMTWTWGHAQASASINTKVVRESNQGKWSGWDEKKMSSRHLWLLSMRYVRRTPNNAWFKRQYLLSMRYVRCRNFKGKAQRVETNALVYCNVPKGKAEPNVSVTTTTLSEYAETYLSVLKQMLR